MKRHTASTSSFTGDAVMSPAFASTAEPEQISKELFQVRHQAISEAAYWRAEERDFAAGGELDDWLGAEAAFDGMHAGNVMV